MTNEDYRVAGRQLLDLCPTLSARVLPRANVHADADGEGAFVEVTLWVPKAQAEAIERA